MIKKIQILFTLVLVIGNFMLAQDLSQGYVANDLDNHAMQPINKPAYLDEIIDPSFNSTIIKRISNAETGNFIVPMYSTIQAWNADESLMIIYGNGVHKLLNGNDYTFIRDLSDINPDDVETIFWHFTNPNIFFYIDNTTFDLVSYEVDSQIKTTIVNLATITGCSENITGGNDVQMMSWDSDVICFRCGNTSTYYYKISTNTITQFNISNINFTAPMPFPSGNLFFHNKKVYDSSGSFVRDLNIDTTEHSCLGRLSNGEDAVFAIAFEEGPNSGCQGTLVAYNATNGNCFSVTPVSDYAYPKSGTHVSSLAHNNTEGGWVAVSSMGYDLDGQVLLDQELFIAKVNANNADVYRVAHHRSDEDDFDYWGEPHVTISPSGTRLLFGSDWSGAEDGNSVDSYIAELQSHTLSINTFEEFEISLYPNPVKNVLTINTNQTNVLYKIVSISGKIIFKNNLNTSKNIDVSKLSEGLYFITLSFENKKQTLKFIKVN